MGSQYPGSNVYPSDYTIPDDGDTLDVASVNVAFEALGDRTTWLKTRTGVYYLANLQMVSAATGFPNPGWAVDGTGATTYDAVILDSNAGGIPTVVGDIVEVGFTAGNSVQNAGAVATRFGFKLRDSQGAGAETDISGAHTAIGVPASAGSPFYSPATVHGGRTITTAGRYRAYLKVVAETGQAGDLCSSYGGINMYYKIWRST